MDVLYVFYDDGNTKQWVDASPAVIGDDTAVIMSENTPTPPLVMDNCGGLD